MIHTYVNGIHVYGSHVTGTHVHGTKMNSIRTHTYVSWYQGTLYSTVCVQFHVGRYLFIGWYVSSHEEPE